MGDPQRQICLFYHVLFYEYTLLKAYGGVNDHSQLLKLISNQIPLHWKQLKLDDYKIENSTPLNQAWWGEISINISVM